MSTILDALKKSERDRTLVRGIGFGDAGPYLPAGIDWLPWVIAAVTVVTLSVVATVLVKRSQSVVTVPAANSSSTSASAPQQVAGDDSPGTIPSNQSNDTTSAAMPVRDLAIQGPDALSINAASAIALVPAVGEAKLLSAMEPEFQQTIPPMAVTIHVYSPDDAQRILYINNQQYYRGSEVSGGVVVEDIVPDGVVLQFGGQRFKLPRPS